MNRRSEFDSGPSKKHLKIGSSNGESQLSNLPDFIISKILSCLPTKDAVRTSVLSKEWEYKWTSIYNIDIDDKILFSKHQSGKINFVNFVERILLLTLNVKSFRLSYSKSYVLSSMATWISAVLMRDVESFEVICNRTNIVLPSSLFLSCLSLRNLKLSLDCTFRVPSENCFPNLTNLYLRGVEILNEHSSNDPLKLTFPVLVTFELMFCKWLKVKDVEIYAPALTMFICATNTASHPDEVKDYSIKLCGASLKQFQSTGNILEHLVLSGSQIAYATLMHLYGRLEDSQYLEKCELRVQMLLKEFKGLEELELSTCVAKVIAQSKHRTPLLMYNKLERLVLWFMNDVEALLVLLHAAPSLKFLIVEEVFEWGDYDYDALESVPLCIISHLEEIEFKHFYGQTFEYELAKFLLKNATELKKLHLCSAGRQFQPKKKEAIVKKLSAMPKRSACLTIVVVS